MTIPTVLGSIHRSSFQVGRAYNEVPMGNTQVRPATTTPMRDASDAPDFIADRVRDFHFAVTWAGLFEHLDPIEASSRRPRATPQPSSLALVPAVVPLAPTRLPIVEHPYADHDSTAAWEMVVPKMVRTSARTFIPAGETGGQS